MATREENLKTINDKLEKLSDEELDNVAGGEILRELVFDQKKEHEDKIIHVRGSAERLLML